MRAEPIILFATVSMLCAAMAHAGEAVVSPLASVVTAENLDLANCAEFPPNETRFAHGGYEKALMGAIHAAGPMAPHFSWTTGPSDQPAVHLRIAFKQALPIGTVIGADGWQVSTLKDAAPPPGDVADEAQWDPVPDVAGQSGLRVLPLPKTVTTRAVRLTQVRELKPGEKKASSMPGIVLLSARLYNYTPEAIAYAGSEAASNEQEREQNGVQNLVSGGRWQNRREEPIAPEKPEWVILWWDAPRSIRGVGLLDAFAKRAEIDFYTGPAEAHPLTAAPEQWQSVAGGNVPIWWRPAYTDFYLDLGQEFTTTGLRLRIVEPLTNENPDIAHSTGGKRTIARLSGFLALSDLGDKPVPPRPKKESEPPPIQVQYTMPMDGRVAIAINGADGTRVRNLIADAPRPKGPNTEPWDGTDDSGKLVPPGDYTVKVLSHANYSLKWQATPHNARDVPWWSSPSWGGQLGPGSFLSDHAAPCSACLLGDKVFIGAEIAESGHCLAALDLDGKKLWGTKWLDTAGASVLATDGRKLYVGAEGGWIGGTVMIFEVDPETYAHRRIVQFGLDAAKGITGGIVGLAANDGKVYAAFNAPPRSALQGVLSGSNIDVPNCLPSGADNPQFGNAGSLAALLRAGGTPTPHHWVQAGGGDDARSIRIAFKAKQPVGTIVLPACGGEFFALKADALYPGDPADDAQWLALPSQTADGVQVVMSPPSLQTRALLVRWTRGEKPKEQFKPGLLGFKILGPRFRNAIEAASISASSGIPGPGGGWTSEQRPENKPISPADPETLTLSWAEPQAVRGIALIDARAKQIEIDAKSGNEWKRVATMNPPVWWRPSYHDDYCDFGKELEVLSIRLRITRALVSENPDVASWTGGKPLKASIGGIAVLQGIGGDPPLPPDLSQRIAVYSAADGTLVNQFAIAEPRGIEFNAKDELFAISGKQVVLVDTESGKATPVIATGLDDPADLCFGPDGSVYVSDGGKAQQVKVFGADGKFVRAIGKAGPRLAGRYEPSCMANPRGIDLDSRGRLWVAENDYQPKRASWWNAVDGKFIGEIMGPARYGGGGWLDPQDKSSFFYGGMEFKIDWDAPEEGEGEVRPQGNDSWVLQNIIWRGSKLPAGAPERPIYCNGRRFIVTDPGHHYGPIAMVTEYRDGRAVPLAMAGPASAWPLLEAPEFIKALGVDLTGKGFIWLDKNGDAAADPSEVQLGPNLQAAYFTSYVGDDLTLNFTGVELPANGFDQNGVPEYSFDKLVQRKPMPVSGTYSTALLPDGSLFGVTSPIMVQIADGTVRWTYPENYLGVHASHRAPRPKQGECTGSLTYIGHAESHVGLLIGLVSNFGYCTLFTDDGLHAGRLFDDYRNGVPGWHTDAAERGMEVGGFSLGGEHFNGSFTRTADGKYYVVAGHNHSSIVEVQGLDTLQRGKFTLTVTPKDALACEAWHRRRALEQQKQAPPKFIRAPRIDGPAIDGDLAEWQNADSAPISERPSAVGVASARIAWNANSLLLAFQVKDDSPMLNTGADPKMLFKTGDSIDLQLGTDPAAPPQRMEPVPGDLRLLVTWSGGKPLGVLYRHRVRGTARDNATLFSSPSRTEQVDEITVLTDLQAAMKLGGGGYALEAAIPLKTLGLAPSAGLRLKADLGVLRGDPKGEETRERLYWANPATAIINDIPSEIMLCPAAWGTVEFR